MIDEEIRKLLKEKGKSFKITMTKCKKCKSKLDLRVTTELSPEDEEKEVEPNILLLYGLCDKCEIVYMLRAIPIKEIPKFVKDEVNEGAEE